MLPRCRSKNSTTDRLRSELDAAYFRTPFLCYFLVSDDEQTSTEELLTAGKSKTGAGTPTGNLRKRLDGPNSINQHGYPTELMSAQITGGEAGNRLPNGEEALRTDPTAATRGDTTGASVGSEDCAGTRGATENPPSSVRPLPDCN